MSIRMREDRSWMNHKGFQDRLKDEYKNGVSCFLEQAFLGRDKNDKVQCPCLSCYLVNYQNRETMWVHLMNPGIIQTYNPWIHHGEKDYNHGDHGNYQSERDDRVEMDGGCNIECDGLQNLFEDLRNADACLGPILEQREQPVGEGIEEEDLRPGEMMETFNRLMKDAETPLFPGCETMTKLEFLVNLQHLKCLNGWSDKSLSMLMELLCRSFNHDDSFPKSCYEMKKYTRDLGLNYVRIDACVNDCILYWKEYAKHDSCPKCGVSRWKEDGYGDKGVNSSDTLGKKKKIAVKVLRHFPIIPRIQRLFMSSKISSHMRWHKEKRPDDGVLRHPADAKAWKSFDEEHTDFAKDSRNVRLGLASDGFNPFGNLSTSYSMWPVILIPYNLPPWMCMKSSYCMLSLLIPGPKAPGKDIDVYLQPLIEELKILWDAGVDTFDAHTGKVFRLHAALLWTINDFPAYGDLSGWSTKGALACPVCNKDTHSRRLSNGKKFCFMGHRRWLEADDKMRLNKKSFDGTTERGPPPIRLSGDEVLEQLDGYENVTFGKTDVARKNKQTTLPHNWKKISIFFQLPYWRMLLLPHNLDVMHVEKNVCDNILGTVMSIPGKNKDSLNARLDMSEMGIRPHLHAHEESGKFSIPTAPYTLTLHERRKVCDFLANIRVPDGYSSNISRCVNVGEGKIFGMKSHDCHVFMQDLLAPAFRGILDEGVYQSLVEVSVFFKELCSRTLRVEVLERMEHNIVKTLCKLEQIFPPSFFDVMIHLLVHLADEAKLGGPVGFRYMYPIERYLKTLKSYVRNKARPEGSIAEAYIANECLTFCSRYLSKVETRFNRMERNDVDEVDQYGGISVFSKVGRPLGKVNPTELTFDKWKKAHVYVLRNCPEVDPFVSEYESESDNRVSKLELHEWLQKRITQLARIGDERVSEDIKALVAGPLKLVNMYDGWIFNGSRFHTRRRGGNHKTQNSGVLVKGVTDSGEKDFFGELTNIIELEYDGCRKIPLFECDWYDVFTDGRGIRNESNGIVSVNINRFLTQEPYALISQAKQVFFVVDNKDPKSWRVVVKTMPRNYYDIPANEDNDEENLSHIGSMDASSSLIPLATEATLGGIALVRRDVPDEVVTVDSGPSQKRKR